MDYYKCQKCKKVFDEFEMDYALTVIDKKILCEECRKKEIIVPNKIKEI